MVVTGNRTESGRETELIGLDGSTCNNSVGKFPMAVEYATGNIIGTVPVICGGYDEDGKPRKECYKWRQIGSIKNLSTSFAFALFWSMGYCRVQKEFAFETASRVMQWNIEHKLPKAMSD